MQGGAVHLKYGWCWFPTDSSLLFDTSTHMYLLYVDEADLAQTVEGFMLNILGMAMF